MSTILPIFADVVTVISFLVTCWVAKILYQLRKSYAFKGRHPEIMRDIRKFSSELSQLLDTKQLDKVASEVTLRRCRSSLEALRRLIPRIHIKPVKIAEKAITFCINSKKTSERDLVREIYNKLISVESDLINIKKDDKWR